MIDRSSIMAWNEFVPWTDYAMIEQDLIGMFYKFCRADLSGFFEQIAGTNEGVVRAP